MTERAHTVTHLNPPGLFASPQFTNVVEVPAGANLVLVSGLTGVTPEGAIPDALEDQVRLVFENLRVALASRGLGPKDVVQMRVFLVGMGTTLPLYRQEAATFFAGAPRPATTAVGVSELILPKLKLEIELIAARAD